MSLPRLEPGYLASGVAHLALLAAVVLGFSSTPPFDEQQEAVPVEMITDQQFNQVMKGDKQAEAQKTPSVRATRQADIPDARPTPQVEAKQDVPTPPPPLKRIPDPGEDDVPTPPTRTAALPPPRPDPEPPKAVVTPPPVPTPPMRPPEPRAETKPPPEPPKPLQAEAIEPPRPPQRPKDEPKPDPKPPVVPTPPVPAARPVVKNDTKKLDDLTKLASLAPPDKVAEKPTPRPRSGDESSQAKSNFNSSAISQLLSKEPPGQKPSSARQPAQLASLGTPTANAVKMSPSMWGQLDGYLQDQYKQCWSYLNLGQNQTYIPRIQVEYAADGALVGTPALLNPPSDPAMRGLADSAMRAVRRCNPMKIPAQFTPYYEQWRSRTLRFNPEDMAG